MFAILSQPNRVSLSDEDGVQSIVLVVVELFYCFISYLTFKSPFDERAKVLFTMSSGALQIGSNWRGDNSSLVQQGQIDWVAFRNTI